MPETPPHPDDTRNLAGLTATRRQRGAQGSKRQRPRGQVKRLIASLMLLTLLGVGTYQRRTPETPPRHNRESAQQLCARTWTTMGLTLTYSKQLPVLYGEKVSRTLSDPFFAR